MIAADPASATAIPEDPHSSALFSKYPAIAADPLAADPDLLDVVVGYFPPPIRTALRLRVAPSANLPADSARVPVANLL